MNSCAVRLTQSSKPFRYPFLRVAYEDEVPLPAYNSVGKHLKKVYSVLVKWENGKEEEVYRVQLPGPMRIGEGKPENQNHALIFTRGDGVQAIDMNQVMAFTLFATAVKQNRKDAFQSLSK